MRFITQDILTMVTGVICHQVNCMGVMGAGLAKQIRAKFPLVYQEYMAEHLAGRLTLGEVIFTTVSTDPPLYIASMCGQQNYGRHGNFTNNFAFEACLKRVAEFRDIQAHLGKAEPMAIYMPYKIGCGLAGGNWNDISVIIDRVLPDTILCARR